MDNNRATKRRKLDAGSAPLPVHAEQPQASNEPGTSHDENLSDTIEVASVPNPRKRARKSDVASSPAPLAQTPGKPKTNGTTTPKTGRQSGKVGSSRKTMARVNGDISISRASIDVEMEDAPSIATGSQADSLDLEAPRTSARKRQKSRKLEEAHSVKSSPANPRGRRGSAAHTPSKDLASSRSTPATGAKKQASKRKTPSKAVNLEATNGSTVESTPSKQPTTKPASSEAIQETVSDSGREPSELPVGPPAVQPPKTVVRRKRAQTTPKHAKDSEIPDSEPETEDRAPNPVATNNAIHALPEARSPPVFPPPETTKKKVNGVPSSLVSQERPMDLTMQVSLRDVQAPPILSNGHDLQVLEETQAVPLSNISPFGPEELLYLRDAVLAKLNRRTQQRLIGLDTETKKVANLIEQTITTGESNSMVLIGARGSGKTAIVDSILAKQRLLHGNDFHIVRLNGFIHTDDRIAIREIWRQLGREMEIEDDNQVKNFADTMTTLLALLSHPSETGQAPEGHIAKSVIVILDEFDLFTTHPRQTLLYNLFDIAQSRKAPLAVLGLTTRFDIAESLEKRVKSRFSHRQVYVPLAKNFASFKDMCKASLVPDDSNATMLCKRWSSFIDALFESSTSFNTHMQSIYNTTKSIPSFQSSLLLPFSTLRTSASMDGSDIQTHIETSLSLAPPLSPPDSNLTLLSALSTLELALLICAARLLIIHDTESASFPLAYDEYKSLASKARIAASAAGVLATGSGTRVSGIGVARLAWEGLVEKGLVLPVNDRARGGGGVCRVDASLEEIGCVVDSTVDAAGMGKWCREI